MDACACDVARPARLWLSCYRARRTRCAAVPPAPRSSAAGAPSAALLLACAAAVWQLQPGAAVASTGRRGERESRVLADAVAAGKPGALEQRRREASMSHKQRGGPSAPPPSLAADASAAASSALRAADAAVGAVGDAASRVRKALASPPAHTRASLLPSHASQRLVVASSPDGSRLVVTPVRGASPGALAAPFPGVVLALAAAAALAAAFAASSSSRGGRSRAGRFVRDRSLGGRLVRVAEAEATLRDDNSGLSASATAPSARPPVSGAGLDDPPAWWVDPSPPSRVGAAATAAALASAKAAAARLNASRVGGGDYDVADFVGLRGACASASGVGLSLEATQRDALFRGAADIALSSAPDGPGALCGFAPGDLLSGLAGDLGVPRHRAAVLVASATAARLRSGLTDGLAALRRGEAGRFDAVARLAALGAQLRALPLEPTAAEVDMVAQQLTDRVSPSERAQLGELYAAANGAEGADTVNAALGL